jgi:hypothetical protein
MLRLSSQLDIPNKLHSGRVMMPREMTPMYIPNSDVQSPKVDGLLPHFLVMRRMIRKTLASRIGYSEAKLVGGSHEFVRFNIFEYIVDEIWNITTNPLRSCGFAL